MKIYDREHLKERILSGTTGESMIANRIHSLLDRGSKFEGKEIKDFLEDKNLFDEAKKEIYDILTKEHQENFDIAERILWGNETERKVNNLSTYFNEAHTHDLFVGLKKWSKGTLKIDMTFLLYWGLAEEIILSEIEENYNQKEEDFDREKLREGLEEAFSDEKLKEYDPFSLSNLVINNLKRYVKGLDLPLLPEYLQYGEDDEPHQDRLNANMNSVAVIMGVLPTHEWSTLFSELSLDFMMRTETKFFNIFMCHFDIDTPEKMNQVMETFKQYPELCGQNGADLEGYHKDDNARNMFVEFICDSFGDEKDFSYYLSHFQINDLKQFEKLFPYGIVRGKMHEWNSGVPLKKIQEVFSFFGISTVEKFEELLKSIGRRWSVEDDPKEIKLIKDHDISEFQSVCDLLGIEEKEEKFRCWKNDIFSLLIANEGVLHKICGVLEITTGEEKLEFVKKEKEHLGDLLSDFKSHGNIFEKHTLLFDPTRSREENMKDIFNILKKRDIRGKETDEIKAVNDENWMDLTLDYSKMNNEDYYGMKKYKEKINQLFQTIETKDTLYKNLKNIYLKILNGQVRELSYQQLATMQALHAHRVGNLSAMTQMVNVIKEIREKHENEEMEHIFCELRTLEEKIKNWPTMEQTDFYGNIAILLEVSSELTEALLMLLHGFSNKYLKEFSKETLPLIISWTLLTKKDIAEKKDDRNHKPIYGHDPQDIHQITSYVNEIARERKDEQNAISHQTIKSDILSKMSERIQKQFGLKTLPIEKLETNFETIQKYMTYIANIHGHKPRDTKLLGLFFGLQINDKWQEFRAGKEINFSDIFEEDSLNELRRYFDERKKYSLLKAYDETLQTKIQEETVSQRIGNVKTIDTELSSLRQDIQDFIDPDNFPDQVQILQLLLTYGKEVGTTLSLVFQKKELPAQGKIIKQEMETIFGSISPERISAIQTEVKKLSPLTNFFKKIEEINIPSLLQQLNKAKTPNTEIIQIFGKLGEKISTDSGILPLTNDINYVKTLFLNTPNKVNEEEKEKALRYIHEVEQQVNSLYEIKEKIKVLFEELQKQISGVKNVRFEQRMDSFAAKILSSGENEATNLTTKMTNNFDIIIPNIRGCLGCMQKECNNHHNLAFGDPNKFFMAVYGMDEKKTIADTIVDIFPYQQKEEKTEAENEHEKKEKSLTFVIEKVYGERTPDVLLSVIQTIRKKQDEANLRDISIFVGNDALSSCYTNLHHLQEELKDEEVQIVEISLEIERTSSPSGYGYYEFGDNGILISHSDELFLE